MVIYRLVTVIWYEAAYNLVITIPDIFFEEKKNFRKIGN